MHYYMYTYTTYEWKARAVCYVALKSRARVTRVSPCCRVTILLLRPGIIGRHKLCLTFNHRQHLASCCTASHPAALLKHQRARHMPNDFILRLIHLKLQPCATHHGPMDRHG